MSFRLLRMDDNGNQAVVATYATRKEAEPACRDFEARGHKQTLLFQASSGGLAGDAFPSPFWPPPNGWRGCFCGPLHFSCRRRPAC